MLQLTSAAFSSREEIPEQYTCEGENFSPPLNWDDVPDEAESLALVCDDPAAPSGTFTHWIIYNIPPLRDGIPAHFSPGVDTSEGIREGRNSFGNVRYDGPCPPTSGDAHNYHFRLYALDSELDLAPGANRDQLFDVMHDHVIDETELVGTFGRSAGL
jgi:hypothetical protein